MINLWKRYGQKRFDYGRIIWEIQNRTDNFIIGTELTRTVEIQEKAIQSLTMWGSGVPWRTMGAAGWIRAGPAQDFHQFRGPILKAFWTPRLDISIFSGLLLDHLLYRF